MAITDAKHKFVYVNVGTYGSEGDGGVFAKDHISRQIYNNTLPLPEDTKFDGKKLPYSFVADDVFALSTRIMKPYVPSKKVT